MNKRLERISTYINEYDNIADIGCDQAILSEILAKRNIHSIASDIKKNIIENALKRIKQLNLNEYVNFIVSDGVKNIPDNIDTLVISGMGTYTILNILKESKKLYKKIITVSNGKYEELRTGMSDIGYKVDKEEIILDKKKYYNLIIFIPGNKKYTKEELILGINHQNKENLLKKLSYDLKKYKKIYSLSKDKNIYNKIQIIEKKLENH